MFTFKDIRFDRFTVDPEPLGDGEQTVSARMTCVFETDSNIDGVRDPRRRYGFRLSVYGSTTETPDIPQLEELELVEKFERVRFRMDCGTIIAPRRPCIFRREITPIHLFPNSPVLFSSELTTPRTYEMQTADINFGVLTADLDKAKGDPIFLGGGFFGGFTYVPEVADRTFLFAEIVDLRNGARRYEKLSHAVRKVYENVSA